MAQAVAASSQPQLLPPGGPAAAPAAAASAAPIPAATSADVAQAALQQSLAAQGTIAVSAEEVVPLPKTMVAEVDKKKSQLVWHLERKVEWRGEKYKLKINFPLKKSEKEMSDQEKQDFKHAAEQFADLFVQDLLKELVNLKSTEAEVIRIFFDDDNGYTVSTDETYNPQDPKTAEGKDVVFAKSDASKALSTAITNEKRTPEVMRQLLEAPALANLRETAQKQNAEKSKAQAPVGLEWDRNSCFIHAPFQQLVNEPTIADDLAKPAHYNDGENNPLFRAVKKYRECQATGESFDAASILRELLDDSGKFQDAIEHGWQAFEDLFDFDKIPESSHLHSLFSNPVRIQVGKESDAPDLSTLAETELGSEDPPAVFSLQVQDRLTATEEAGQPLLSDKVSEEECLTFLTDIAQTLKPQAEQLSDDVLAALNIPLPPYGEDFTPGVLSSYLNLFVSEAEKKKFCERIVFDTIKAASDNEAEFTANPTQYLTDAIAGEDESLGEVAAELLNNKAILQAALELLTADQKKAINAHRTPRLEYNDTLVEIADTGQLTIKRKTYDIASFTCYIPEREHFITYVRKGDKCYKLDDLSKTNKVDDKIDLKDFVTAARGAYFYTIRDKRLTPKPAVSADAAQSQKPAEPVVESNAAEKPIRTEGSPVELVIETGSMKAAGNKFALVNPSDSGLKYLHPQLVDEVMDADQFETTVKSATEADKRWHDWFTSPHKARGQSWYSARHDHGILSSGPRPLVTRQKKQKIIHVPLPSLTDENDVAQAIIDTLDFAKSQGITHVAFPEFSYRGSGDIVQLMQTAIQEYLKTHDWREGSHIKIIRREAAPAA